MTYVPYFYAHSKMRKDLLHLLDCFQRNNYCWVVRLNDVAAGYAIVAGDVHAAAAKCWKSVLNDGFDYYFHAKPRNFGG